MAQRQPDEVWKLSSSPLGALALLQVSSVSIQPTGLTGFQEVQAELVWPQPPQMMERVCWQLVLPGLAVSPQQKEPLRLAKQGPFSPTGLTCLVRVWLRERWVDWGMNPSQAGCGSFRLRSH